MKKYIIRMLFIVGLVIGFLVLIIKGLLLTMKVKGGLIYPKGDLLYPTLIMFGVAITLGIVILSHIFRNKKPDVPSEEKPKGKEKKEDKKDNKEPTFLDFVIVMSFILFLIFVGVLLADKVNWAFKQVFSTEKKVVKNIESVVIKEETRSGKEETWELAWQKPSFVLGNFPEKRSERSKIKFLRKDNEVMEFIAIANGSFSKGTHFMLTSEQKDIGRKWRGEYYDQISKTSGWVGFDEIGDEYIGEHSVDKTGAEWIPTEVRLKK
jgi:hypothetical protein